MNSGNTRPILDQYQTGTSSNFEDSSDWNHFWYESAIIIYNNILAVSF